MSICQVLGQEDFFLSFNVWCGVFAQQVIDILVFIGHIVNLRTKWKDVHNILGLTIYQSFIMSGSIGTGQLKKVMVTSICAKSKVCIFPDLPCGLFQKWKWNGHGQTNEAAILTQVTFWHKKEEKEQL